MNTKTKDVVVTGGSERDVEAHLARLHAPLEVGERVRVTEGNHKDREGVVTGVLGRPDSPRPMVMLDALGFSQPGYGLGHNLERVAS